MIDKATKWLGANVTPEITAAASLALTFGVVLFSLPFLPADVAWFKGTLAVAAATGAVTVTLLQIRIMTAPACEELIGPLKSALADFSSHWGGFALILGLLVEGKVS